MQLGKLDVVMSDLVESLKTEGFLELPLTTKHALPVMNLPNYHRDPFDRMLI